MRAGRATLLALWTGIACAAPADDHERGIQAYQRGDVVTAMSALRGAARAGHAPSQAMLGFILDRADFIDEAALLYRDAAAQDDAEGHAGLANLYLTGRGVAKDEKRALVHFSKAAELGHAASADALARAYRTGRHGLAADPVQAAAWQARAMALRPAQAAPVAKGSK